LKQSHAKGKVSTVNLKQMPANPLGGNGCWSARQSALAICRRHVIISGTGRAGTTFLVQLLTHLGLDTGFTPKQLAQHIDSRALAGLEHDIRSPECPYIVKNPNLTDYIEDVIEREDIIIEHVFIPMRCLHAAAQSRRHVQNKAKAEWPLHKRISMALRRAHKQVNGGLTFTTNEKEQETVLLYQLYKLLLSLSNQPIPVTLLQFPRIVTDCRFLFEKLKPILAQVEYRKFEKAFRDAACPELVHRFPLKEQ
jgi:hypothetical protein